MFRSPFRVFRWLRRVMTVMLIVSNFATVMLVDAAPAQPDAQPSFPIRAAFYYPWFPQAWKQSGINPYTNYNPSLGLYDGANQGVIKQHIGAMQYGGIQAGILPSVWEPCPHQEAIPAWMPPYCMAAICCWITVWLLPS